MRFSEINESEDILNEALPAFGPNMSHINDLRDPDQGPAKVFRYEDSKTGERKVDRERVKTFVAFQKGGGVVIFNYGNGVNKVDWTEVLIAANSELDKNIQSNELDIRVFRSGYMINAYNDGPSWSGKRNRYSPMLRKVAQALLDSGLAENTTPLWIGNWAREDPEPVGSVGKILATNPNPSRLYLFHGTSNFRLAKIMRDGLTPREIGDRIWSKDNKKHMPAHRADSIYLTADLGQAEYYANKAVNTDRARLSKVAYYEPWKTNPKAINPASMNIEQMRAYVADKWRDMPRNLEFLKGYNDDQVRNVAERYLRDQSAFDEDRPDKLAPVILQVVLGTADMKKLMADDDFLRTSPDATPEEWMRSLGHFGQIAYRGSIPPNRIRVFKGKNS